MDSMVLAVATPRAVEVVLVKDLGHSLLASDTLGNLNGRLQVGAGCDAFLRDRSSRTDSAAVWCWGTCTGTGLYFVSSNLILHSPCVRCNAPRRRVSATQGATTARDNFLTTHSPGEHPQTPSIHPAARWHCEPSPNSHTSIAVLTRIQTDASFCHTAVRTYACLNFERIACTCGHSWLR